MGSASAKWALLAPIFVPMLMLMGYSPETTQAAYRIGDSYSNILTPLLPYFPLVIVFAQKYVKNVGIGTLISLMLPYSIAFMVVRLARSQVWKMFSERVRQVSSTTAELCTRKSFLPIFHSLWV